MKYNEKAEIEKYCAFCERSIPTFESDKVLCDKKGVVNAGFKCKSFRYDPQKREPARIKIKNDN